MKLSTLQDLLIHQLRDLHSAETQLLRALPKVVDAASHQELRDAVEYHLEEILRQVNRLNDIFERLGAKRGRKKCKAMQGLLDEVREMYDADTPQAVHDAALIAGLQRIEHDEIAAYGCAMTFALALKDEDTADVRAESQEEEVRADEKLTEVAMIVLDQPAADDLFLAQATRSRLFRV